MTFGKRIDCLLSVVIVAVLSADCADRSSTAAKPDTSEAVEPAGLDDSKSSQIAQPSTQPDEDAAAPDKTDGEVKTDASADAKPTDDTEVDDAAVTDTEAAPAPEDEPANDEPEESETKKPHEGSATELAAVDKASADKTAPADGVAHETTRDWVQWGGSPQRNNTPVGSNIPHAWTAGEFEGTPAKWNPETAKNVKWVTTLGSQSYGNAVVAGGKVFVGTNNSAGWLKRYPADVDLGCLLAFRAEDGEFLWQHSSEKLKTGRVHDWPLQGICCAPYVEGDRLWFVTSRGEVRCLDTEGFLDGENDGPYEDEYSDAKDEADVIWVFDMMKELGVSQHNMAACSVTASGDLLFVNTSNGVDESHILMPAPDAPSFMAMDKKTGKVLWTDGSPGINILHGQWSSPTSAELGGMPQVIFGGGDGWVYSFHAEGAGDGKPRLLWKFDANPKESKWILGGRGTRNNIIATPVVHEGLVYVAVGQDPEHAEGNGHLWCIDPTKKLDGSDVSPTKVFHVDNPDQPVPHRRLQACDPTKGEVERDNPDSAVVWHYEKYDLNGDGEYDWEEEMHRSCGTVAIKDGLLYIADFSGLFHCLDAKTGKAHWTYDMLAAAWGSPLIVDDKVYIGDEDGDLTVFKLSKEMEILSRDEDGEPGPINMGNAVYSTPIVADNVLYISNKTHLFAIAAEDSRVAKANDDP